MKLNKAKIKRRKNKNFYSKLIREKKIINYKPWFAIFIMIAPTVLSAVIFSTYQIFDKLIATQWAASSIIFYYKDIIDISYNDALKIINIVTTYTVVPSSIIVSFALLVSVGTSAKFSINLLKIKFEKKAKYLGNDFLLSFLISVIFMIIMYFIVPFIIKFQAENAINLDLEINNIIINEAIRFSQILVLGSPLLFFSNFWLSLLRSQGRLTANNIIIISSCLINIIFAFIFVIPANLGIEGTAYATVISWLLIFIISIILIYYGNFNLKFNFHHLKLKKEVAISILIIGFTWLLENIVQSILIMMMIKILNALPGPIDYPNISQIPIYLQLYGGIIPWLILINALVVGISQGAKVLVGYVYETRNYQRIWQIIWRLFLLLLILLSSYLLLISLLGDYMMSIFGVELAMAKNFKSYIIIQFLFYPLASLHFIAVIFYQGINHNKTALFASLQKTIVMPILCLALGYLFAIKTSDGFYFYLMVGLIDLFSAFILLPLLIHALIRTKPYLKRSINQQKVDSENNIREVETLNIK